MSQSNNDYGKAPLAGTDSLGSGVAKSGRGNISVPDSNNAAPGDGNGGFYATSSFPGLVVTSEEINFLVYRYLQESGKEFSKRSKSIKRSRCGELFVHSCLYANRAIC